MACRISLEKFERLAWREGRRVGLGVVFCSSDPAAAPMVHVEVFGRIPRAVVHRKPIQALVDKPRQAKPILRNLLRWAKEQGAR